MLEDEGEDWEPPPIFISYQWGNQQQVKLLHQHLAMAGYKGSVNRVIGLLVIIISLY